jgi:hypothetical protein
MNDSSNAISRYRELTNSEIQKYRSVAYQQLGILDTNSGRYEEAEEDFRNALRADPANEEARYNYELLKKKMKDQKNQQQNKQDQQQNKQDQDQNQKQKQENKDQNKQDQQKDQQQQQQDQKNDKQNKDQQQKQDQGQNKEKQNDKQKEDKQNAQQADAQQQQQNEKDKENKQLMKNENTEVKKISEDKAKMILEAMRNSEQQYLQQRQRKATKKSDSGKPDW